MTPRTKGRFILLPMLLCVCLTFCSCAVTRVPKNLLQYPLTLQQGFISGYHSCCRIPGQYSCCTDRQCRRHRYLWEWFRYSGCLPYGRSYLMVSYSGSNSKVKLQITGSDEITYTYNLHDVMKLSPHFRKRFPTPSAYLKILREPVIPPFLRRQLMWRSRMNLVHICTQTSM